MSAFEHITLLLSFVYALAIAHLLATVARLIENSDRVRFSWVHAAWMLIALFTNLIAWIGWWDMKSLTEWPVWTILFTFAFSFANYVQAALVCPRVAEEGPVDLPRFHESNRRRYIGAFLLSALFMLVGNTAYGYVAGMSNWARDNVAAIPILVLGAAAFVFRAKWVQRLAPLAILALIAFYFSQLQPSLR